MAQSLDLIPLVGGLLMHFKNPAFGVPRPLPLQSSAISQENTSGCRYAIHQLKNGEMIVVRRVMLDWISMITMALLASAVGFCLLFIVILWVQKD